MRKSIVVVLVLSMSHLVFAQNIEKKINKVFEAWNQNNHPGGVVSILSKDNPPVTLAYGLSNIKYEIPHTAESVFNIGSVSKQFTAMGIILLHTEGKLNFDDDIRAYLPELNEFETTITLRHLLHHTSGIRSTPELFGLAGWRDGDAITTDDDYRYLCKQKDLNFEPGSQFMYSNSNYVLLAKIIEKVAVQNFNDWMKENIFIPLGMNNTFVDEVNSNTNPKVATPYNEFEENVFTYGENISLDIGASNVYSTATDMTRWMKNFTTPTNGWAEAFSLMQTVDSLSNGDDNDYAFGVMVEEFYGNSRIQHMGAVPGFLSYAMYYPQEELTIVLLANFVSHAVEDKFQELTQLFIKNKSVDLQKKEAVSLIEMDVVNAKNVVGDYWNVKENYERTIYFDQDTLWYQRTNGTKSPLLQTGVDEFVIGGINAEVLAKFNLDNEMTVTETGKPLQTFEKYTNTAITEDELLQYVGAFYSEELETTYKINLLNGQLMGYHTRHGEFPIERLKKDVLDWSGFAISKIKRDDLNMVIGFYVSLNRVENVWFGKLD